MILFMDLEMFGEIIDPLRQDRNLNIRGSCVALMPLELIDDFFLFLYA